MSTYSFNETAWHSAIEGTALQDIGPAIVEAINDQGHALKHGHLPAWEAAVQQLPASPSCPWRIEEGAITIDVTLDTIEQSALTEALHALMPWRKGPFAFGATRIETEWHSDWKWNRLLPHISSLGGRTVLDVGCGSGYHLWRIRDAGARFALGIDPSLLYVKQFEATQHFIQDSQVQLLPLTMQALPRNMQLFDTIFSMGVLYHRREPNLHLQELKEAMRADAELVLETLIVPDEEDESLIIHGRYANMRNIYQLPTLTRLCRWVREAGLVNITVADINITSRLEQRTTAWMPSHSLTQALNHEDNTKTIEGHPRPLRAILVAQNP